MPAPTACSAVPRRRPAGESGSASSGSARVLAVGLDLEPVLAVEVAALAPAQEARQPVERQEQRPPAHVLRDVDVLVIAGVVEALAVLPEDDVAQRHCPGAAAELPQEVPGEPAVHL